MHCYVVMCATEAIANLDKEQAENDGKVFGFAPNNLKEIASELLTVFEPVEALLYVLLAIDLSNSA